MFNKPTNEKSFSSLDEQIEFVREVEIKLLMVQNTLAAIGVMIDAQTDRFEIDHNILSSLGIVHDGISYVSDCLGDTLHDSELSGYKTTSEKFLESDDRNVERAYRDHVRVIYNENKL